MARELKPSNLHVELKQGDLETLVDEVARRVWEDCPHGADDQEGWQTLRSGVRQVLRQYIVGYDVCGLSLFCETAERFDPWEKEPVSRV